MPEPDVADSAVDLGGDAAILLTAPFYPAADPLVERPVCQLSVDGLLDDEGYLKQVERPMDALLRGSLTYGTPQIPALSHFEGTAALADKLAHDLQLPSELSAAIGVRGVLFADGYGSIAVRVDLPGGWDEPRRAQLLAAFGRAGREPTASAVRSALLTPLTQMSHRCGPGDNAPIEFPYFNQTYAGQTSHPYPGRAALADHLRTLVYPRSPAPAGSDSPWYDEYFYAGCAYNLLASATTEQTLHKLELLLLHLDVLYARLARSAAAADRAIREQADKGDVDWLVQLELRLRADYQGLVTPTFSFDFHVLKLRDALLSAWDTDALHARTESLLTMARQAVERRLAQQQARRVSLVNRGIAVLTVLSVVATADAALNLWDKLS